MPTDAKTIAILDLESNLHALSELLEFITHLGDEAREPADYARDLGKARARAEIALTRLRIIRSLLT